MRRIRKWSHSPGIALIAAVAGQALVAGSASGQIFSNDWNSTPQGQLPDSVVVLEGTAEVTSRNGAKVIRVGPNTRGRFSWTVLEVRFGSALPDDFTIEFDLHAPLSTSYPLEIRAALAGDPLAYLGATARQNRVVANCGAVRTGVYGNLQNTLSEKQDRFDTTGVHRCRIAVTGNRVEVGYAAVTLAQDNVDFKRSNRIALVVPARAGMEAHIGPLTVSGRPDAIARMGPGTITSTAPSTAEISIAAPPPQTAAAPAATQETAPIAAVDPAAQTTSASQSPLAAATSHAQARRAAGAAATVTGAELKQQFALSRDASAGVLHNVGYTIPQVASWLKADGAPVADAVLLSQLNGGSVSLLYDMVTQVYGLEVTAALKTLIGAGLELKPLVVVLHQRGMSFLQAGPHVIAAAPDVHTAGDALRAAYNPSAGQFIQLLKAMGVEVPTVIRETVDLYGVLIGEVMKQMRLAGYSARDIAGGVKTVTFLAPRQVAQHLMEAGFDLDLTMDALMHNYVLGVESAIEVFRQLGISPTNLMLAVQRIYKRPAQMLLSAFIQAGFAFSDVFGAMKGAGLSLSQAAKGARDAGYGASTIIGPLLLGYATESAGAGLAAAKALIDAGYTPNQTATALKNHFNETAGWVALNLSRAGVDLAGVRDAIIFAFNLSVQAAVAVLASMNITN